MPRRSKNPKAQCSRDSKVERLKVAAVLLQQRGYFTKEDIGVSRSVFEWYCGVAGGVIANVGRRAVCRNPNILLF